MKNFIYVVLLISFLPSLVISQTSNDPKFEVWKTIDGVVQNYQSINDFYTLPDSSNCTITSMATYIFNKCEFGVPAKEVQFVKIKFNNLGIKKFFRHISYEDILQSANKLGLKPCRPEDVVALRKIYTDQPADEIACIVNTPINDHSGSQYVFTLFAINDHSGSQYVFTLFPLANTKGEVTSFVIDGFELNDPFCKRCFPSKDWVYIFRM